MAETRPIHTLNGLRGYLAIWVLLHHFIKIEGVGGVIHGPELIWAGAVALDTFFVLSGFVLTYAYGTRFSEGFDREAYREHLILRLGRMYPLHVLTLAVLVAAVIAATALGRPPRHADNFAWDLLLPNLLMIHAWFGEQPLNWNYVSWSVSAEWFAYLFLLPGYVWLTARRSPLLWIVLVIAAAIAFDYGIARDSLTGEHFKPSDNAIPRIIIDFFAGVAIYRAWERWPALSARAADVVALLGVAALCVTSSYMLELGALVVPSIMLLVFGLASSGPLATRLFANKAIIHLGETSYSIYLIHPFVMMLSNAIVRRFLETSSVSIALSILLLGSLVSMAIATCTYYWVEMPGRAWARRWIKRRKAARAEQTA